MKKNVNVTENFKWVIVAGLFLCLTVSWGLIFNASSIFVTPIQEELKTDRSVMLLAMVLRGIASVLASFAAGSLMNRYGALKIMRITVVVLVASFFAFGFIRSVPQYLVVVALQVVATTLCGFLPVSVIINDWFPEKNATVMGLAFMGSGIGGMIFNALGGYWITALGWRRTALLLTLIMALVLLPIAFLVLRTRRHEGAVSSHAADLKAAGISLEEARQTPQFWLVLVSFMITSITLTGIVNNLSPAFQDLGYTLKNAALISSAAMISMSAGKILIGQLFYRLGLRNASILANLSTMICLMGLIFGGGIPGVAAVLTGFILGGGFASMSVPILADGIYGRRDFSRMSGVLQSAFNIGSILGPLIMSPLYGATGSYRVSWILFVGLLCINFFIYIKYLPNQVQAAK